MRPETLHLLLAACLLTSAASVTAAGREADADASASGRAAGPEGTPLPNATASWAGALQAGAAATAEGASASLGAGAAAALDPVVNASIGAEANASLAEATRDVPDSATNWASTDMTTPLDGAEVSGVVLLRGTAQAAKGYRIHHVRVSVDGQFLGYANGIENWTFPLDTTRLVDGKHSLSAFAMAAPVLLPGSPRAGWSGARADFVSTNDAPGVLLLDERFEVAGAAAVEPWVFEVAENYTGLRVTLEITPKNGSAAPALGEISVAYQGPPHADAEACPRAGEAQADASARGWVHTYGVLTAGAEIVRPPYGVIEAPGLLTLAGAFGGEGHARIRVEALPAS